MHAHSDNDRLYKIILNEHAENYNIAVGCKNKNCIKIWHSRLGYQNYDGIGQLVRENMVEGIKTDNCMYDNKCSKCIKNKMQQIPYP